MRGLTRRTITLALLATTVAGCTPGPGDTGSPGSSGSPGSDGGSSGGGASDRGASDGGSASRGGGSTAGPTDPLETARAKAAQYDYDAALDALDGAEGQEAEDLRAQLEKERDALETWPEDEPVAHLFFHSLIVDTARAFDGDDSAQGYDDYMCTIPEFTAVLDAMREHGYVLVSPHDIAAPAEDGSMQPRELKLPADKKPFVLSQDDVSYYEYMDGDGFAEDLHLDAQGKVRNRYVDADGAEHEGAYDMVPLLDDYLEEHPGFSYRGHKGVIALTGYNGVLGYRSSPQEYGDDPDALATARDTAAKVADALKETGWEFASHTWGHSDLGEKPMEKVDRDLALWDEEVRSLVGDTDLLIYPFGADIAGPEPYDEASPRYRRLHDHGFRYFFTVDGSTLAWQQRAGEHLRQARMNIDGIRLRATAAGREHVLDPVLDAAAVLDPARPAPQG